MKCKHLSLGFTDKEDVARVFMFCIFCIHVIVLFGEVYLERTATSL